MAKKKTIDNKEIIRAVKEGATTKELLDKFGFKTSTQAKMAYLNAVIEQGIVPKIKTKAGISLKKTEATT